VGAAVLALIGVVIGALTTGWVTFLLDRRREREELRAAMRLVALELGSIAVDLALLAREKSLALIEGPPRTLSTQAWEAERRVLARAISDDLWERIGVFYLNVEGLRKLVEVHVGKFDAGSPTLDRARRHALAANELRQGLGAPPVPIRFDA
jgi:hypothetical protein